MKHSVRVNTGQLTVTSSAPHTWDYRVQDQGLDHMGQFTLNLSNDTEFDAICELISKLFTSAGVRNERLAGADPFPQEAEFPQDVIDWVDANTATLDAVEADTQALAIEAGMGI